MDQEEETYYFLDSSRCVKDFVNISENATFRFKYYSHPSKRAKYLYKRYKGNCFHIWHEGYIDEYKSYNISSKHEEEWLKEIEKYI